MYKVGQKVKVREDFKNLVFNSYYYRNSGEICENLSTSHAEVFALPEQMQKYSGQILTIIGQLPYDPQLYELDCGWVFHQNWLQPAQTLKEL